MSIKETVYSAISAVFANAHAVELPKDPTFPAVVFDISTESESGWCQGAGYEQHTITVVILAVSLTEVETIAALVRTAMGPVSDHNGADAEGDADYETEADIYGYYLEFNARTRRQ